MAAIRRQKIDAGTDFERFEALAAAIDTGSPGDIFAIRYDVAGVEVILETRMLEECKVQAYARTMTDVFLYGDTYEVSGLPDEVVAAAVGDATEALVASEQAVTPTSPVSMADP